MNDSDVEVDSDEKEKPDNHKANTFGCPMW